MMQSLMAIGQMLECSELIRVERELQRYINYIQMTQNDEKSQPQTAPKCYKCKDLYGHENYDLMCSICYKKEKNMQNAVQTPKLTRQPHLHDDQPLPQSKIEAVSEAQGVQREQKEQLPRGRCTRCSKKTGLLGYSCAHCSSEFCKVHRLPEDHNCSVDFIELGRKRIKMDNPLISTKKIEDI